MKGGRSKSEGNNDIGVRSPSFKHGQKGRKRLGGGGLSLEAFAAAKSKPFLQPARIREQREFYQNAKKVQKYRKLVKRNFGNGEHLRRTEDSSANEQSHEDLVGGEGVHQRTQSENSVGQGRRPDSQLGYERANQNSFRKQGKHDKKGNRITQLERLRIECEQEKQLKEIAQKEREALYAAQQETRKQSEKLRKETRVKMRKVTHRGQPVMKHRMQLLLESIQKGS